MSARETSVAAYIGHQMSGVAGNQRGLILEILGNSVMTRREIASESGIETSSVSGRVNEMIAMGMVEECGKRKCGITGKMVNAIRRCGPWQQRKLL